MIRTFALAIATVVVTSAAIAGSAATNVSRTDGTSCTCSTVDLEGESVTLVVLANETGSISQQVSQTNDDVRVRIDVKHGDTSVEIAGETAENGTLVFDVTRNGEVVNESVVADANEIGTIVFHLEPDAVRISTAEEAPSECPCEDIANRLDDGAARNVDSADGCSVASDIVENVNERVSVGGVAEDTNVNAGNISVSLPGPSSDDGDQVIEDDGDRFQSQRSDVEVNLEGCANASSDDSSDIAPPTRPSDATDTGGNVYRVAIRSNDLAGLEGGVPDVSLGGIVSLFDNGESTRN